MRSEKLAGHAVLQPQGIEHELEGQLLARNLVLIADGLPCPACRHIARGLAPATWRSTRCGKEELAVRPGADAEVVAKLPVVEVVLAGAWAGRRPRPRSARGRLRRCAGSAGRACRWPDRRRAGPQARVAKRVLGSRWSGGRSTDAAGRSSRPNLDLGGQVGQGLASGAYIGSMFEGRRGPRGRRSAPPDLLAAMDGRRHSCTFVIEILNSKTSSDRIRSIDRIRCCSLLLLLQHQFDQTNPIRIENQSSFEISHPVRGGVLLVAVSSCATVAPAAIDDTSAGRSQNRPRCQSSLAQDAACQLTHGDQGHRGQSRRCARRPARQTKAVSFTRIDAHAVPRSSRSLLAASLAAPARVRHAQSGRAAPPGAPAQRAVALMPGHLPNAGKLPTGCMPRLGQRVLDEASAGPVRDAECPWFTSSMPSRAEQGLQLGELLGVVGGEDQLHGVQAAACKVPTAPGCPWPQGSKLRHLVAAEGRALGGALHFDKPPGPSSSRHSMSVSRSRVFGVLKVQQRLCLARCQQKRQRPNRAGRRADLAVGQQTVVDGITAARRAPVMAAVRVPPSACSTSQSRRQGALARLERSNTQRSERPMRRWISCMRPDCLFFAASRSPPGVRGARQHAVFGRDPALTEPRPAARASTDAVQSTLCCQTQPATEPSAWMVCCE